MFEKGLSMGNQNMNKEFDSKSESDEDNIDELSMLMNRVSDIEDSISKLSQQQSELTHQVREQKKRMDSMSEEVESLQDIVETLENSNEMKDSKIRNINRSLDNLEEDIQDTKGDIDNVTSQLQQRLKGIEEMMNVDEMEIAKAIKPNACELEQLTTIPEGSRKEEFNVRVQRAVALYEQFQDLSTPIKSGGKRLLSKDVKTFLNGFTQTSIKYTQVQRVIDTFDEKTGNEFSVHNTDDGRAIVWNPD